MNTPSPLTDAELDLILGPFPAFIYEWANEDLEAFARAIESEVNVRWQKMLAGQVPVWYACNTEGGEFDVTFVTTLEEAVEEVHYALADDPDLKFEDLVTPLFTHPASDHTSILRQAMEALVELEYARTDKSEDMALEAISAIKEVLNVPR